MGTSEQKYIRRRKLSSFYLFSQAYIAWIINSPFNTVREETRRIESIVLKHAENKELLKYKYYVSLVKE